MSDAPVSLPGKLFGDTLQRVVSQFGLTEVTGDDGGAYLPLESQANGTGLGRRGTFVYWRSLVSSGYLFSISGTHAVGLAHVICLYAGQ